MKYYILVFLILFSGNTSKADDCQSEKVYHSGTHAFLGCKVTSVTPSYKVRVGISAARMSELGCSFFCSDNTIIPLRHSDHYHIIPIPRTVVNDLLAVRTRQNIQMAPENFLRLTLETILFSEGHNIEEQLWEQHVQSLIRQRDTNKQLDPKSLKEVALQDLSAADQGSLKCSVCQELVASTLTKGSKVVRVNCGNNKGGDIFCKDCIEEAYHYNQNCPNCRGTIKPYSD